MSDDDDTFSITIGGVRRELDKASIRRLKERMVAGPPSEDGALFAAMDRVPGSERGPLQPEAPRGIDEVEQDD
jgi:hypothetical protein